MVCDKDSVAIGEEFTLTLTATWLDISPTLLFYLPQQKNIALKVLTPNGFVQTGGDYYDYIGTTLGEGIKEVSYTLKGKLTEAGTGLSQFTLLRGVPPIVDNSLFEKKAEVSVYQRHTFFEKQSSVTKAKALLKIEGQRQYSQITGISANPQTINRCSSGPGSSVITVQGCNSVVIPRSTFYGNAPCFSSNCTFIVTPTTTTTYLFECNGEVEPITVNVVTTLPPTPTIAGPARVCLGGTGSLTLSASGCGIGQTVRWYKDGSLVSEGNSTSPNNTGNYTATCNQSDGEGYGCESGHSNVVVVGNPVSITTHIDSNCGVTLNALGCSNSGITWSDGSSGSSMKPISISELPKSYSFTCTDGGGSCTASLYVASPKPNITITPTATNVCAGSSVTLNAEGCPSNGTVTWDNNLGTGVSKTFTATTSTLYKATCSVGNCSSEASAYVQVQFKPSPPSVENSPVTIPNGQNTYTLSVTGCGNGTQRWYNTSNTSQPLTSTTVGSGTYVSRCSVNGCTSDLSGVFTLQACNVPPQPIL